MTNAPTKRKKRTPVPRSEGERRLVEATIELAGEQPYGELSAREIARRADMNHGYVHVWFGSKAGLIHAAYVRQSERLLETLAAGELTLTVDALTHPDVELLFRLLGRLQIEPGGIELARQHERPLRNLIAQQVQRRSNLSPSDADTAAAFAVAAAAGVATVGRVLDLDVEALVRWWPQIARSFAGD
jgi:TetR/AcrR family transcriptional regulator, repressor for neighboring sulfatase